MKKKRRKTRDAPPAWGKKKGEETNKKKKKWRWQQTFNTCGKATQLINQNNTFDGIISKKNTNNTITLYFCSKFQFKKRQKYFFFGFPFVILHRKVILRYSIFVSRGLLYMHCNCRAWEIFLIESTRIHRVTKYENKNFII